ncbi:TatD family hydrolase [Bacteroidota bacterium]
MFIDTHAHLFYPNFNGEVNEVIDRAREAGIEKIIVPATDIASSAQATQLADQYDLIYATVGIHPHDTKEWEDSLLKDLAGMATHEKVVAIGEIGLDYYYDFSPKDIQQHAFEAQINLALELDKPIVVHNRESNEDVMAMINKYFEKKLRAQFHCFAGTSNDARALIEMGHYISFTGNITHAKADNVRKVLGSVSLENLFLETDSPFMTPVPHRGKRNEPAYVKLVAEKVAEVHNTTVENVAKITTENAKKFFGI